VIAWKGGSAAVDESLTKEAEENDNAETPLDSARASRARRGNAEKKESASCCRRSVGRCLCRNC